MEGLLQPKGPLPRYKCVCKGDLPPPQLRIWRDRAGDTQNRRDACCKGGPRGEVTIRHETTEVQTVDSVASDPCAGADAAARYGYDRAGSGRGGRIRTRLLWRQRRPRSRRRPPKFRKSRRHRRCQRLRKPQRPQRPQRNQRPPKPRRPRRPPKSRRHRRYQRLRRIPETPEPSVQPEEPILPVPMLAPVMPVAEADDKRAYYQIIMKDGTAIKLYPGVTGGHCSAPTAAPRPSRAARPRTTMW